MRQYAKLVALIPLMHGAFLLTGSVLVGAGMLQIVYEQATWPKIWQLPPSTLTMIWKLALFNLVCLCAAAVSFWIAFRIWRRGFPKWESKRFK